MSLSVVERSFEARIKVEVESFEFFIFRNFKTDRLDAFIAGNDIAHDDINLVSSRR